MERQQLFKIELFSVKADLNIECKMTKDSGSRCSTWANVFSMLHLGGLSKPLCRQVQMHLFAVIRC